MEGWLTPSRVNRTNGATHELDCCCSQQ
jgi:hypothetical protein